MNFIALVVAAAAVASVFATWRSLGWLGAFAVATVEVAIYVVILRPWLRKKAWAQEFFTNPVTEWVELHMFRKSETLMWNRWQMFMGTALTSLQSFGAIDITPLVTVLTFVLPDKYKWVAQFIAQSWPMVFALIGMIGEFQRRDTTKPLVAVAVASDAPPEVKQMVREIEETNALAEHVYQEAKAEGEI